LIDADTSGEAEGMPGVGAGFAFIGAGFAFIGAGFSFLGSGGGFGADGFGAGLAPGVAFDKLVTAEKTGAVTGGTGGTGAATGMGEKSRIVPSNSFFISSCIFVDTAGEVGCGAALGAGRLNRDN